MSLPQRGDGVSEGEFIVERPNKQLSAEQYRENLHATLKHIRSTYPYAVTVFLTPSTVETETILAIEKGSGMPERFWSYRTPERAKELAEVCKEVAKEEEIDCIDVFAMHEGKQDIFTDGLHYNADGYKVGRAIAVLISACERRID